MPVTTMPPSTGRTRVYAYGDFDTYVDVFTGTAVDALTPVGGGGSEYEFNATSGTTYRIRVAGDNGSDGLFDLYLYHDPAPANDGFAGAMTLTGQTFATAGILEGSTLEAGEAQPSFLDGPYREAGSLWFNWTPPASGRAFLSSDRGDYWAFLGVYTGSAVNALTEVAYDRRWEEQEVEFTVAGGTTYRIQILNPNYYGGSFQLEAFAPPANDNVADAEMMEGAACSATGNTYLATVEANEPVSGADGPFGCGISYGTVWYTWTAPFTGEGTAWTENSDYQANVFVYQGTGGSLTLADPDDYEPDNYRYFEAVAGTTYTISVDRDENYNWGTPFTLYLSAVPGNDDFADAEVLTGEVATAEGSNEGASSEYGEPYHDPVDEGYPSVWWSWTAPSAGMFTVSTEGSSFDTLLAIYSGTEVSGLQRVAQNDNACPDRTSLVVFTAVAGTTYHIVVDGWDEQTGTIALSIHPGEFVEGFSEARSAQVTKLQIKLNFAKDGADSIVMSGVLPLPAGTAVGGAEVSVDVGGVFGTFTLDAKGNSPAGNSTFKAKARSGTGAQNVKFSAKFAKGDFLADLANDGIADATVTAQPVLIPVWIDFGGTVFETKVQLLYKAKAGKSGSAK